MFAFLCVLALRSKSGLTSILTPKVEDARVLYESISMYTGQTKNVDSVAFKIFGKDIDQ